MPTAGAVKFLKVVNRDHCIGCYSCMYACSRMLRNFASCEKAALRVKAYAGVEGAFSIRVCARCVKPDCAAVCPTKALSVALGGGVRLKKELCVRCGKCVAACKISAMQWDEVEKMPLPCIQCGQCVKYCPNRVIELSERTESAQTADKEAGA